MEFLPYELIVKIGTKLSLSDVLRFSLVKKRFSSLLEDNYFWQSKYFLDFSETPKERWNCKEEYKDRYFGNAIILGPFISDLIFSDPPVLGRRSSPLMKRVLSIKAREISAGGAHILILDPEGATWTYGDNGYGQTGISPLMNISIGALTRLELPKARMVSAGGYHSIVITDSYDVIGFGDNTEGQLGFGVSRLGPRQAPAYIYGFKAKAVSAGKIHTILLGLDSSIWVFGSNLSGMLALDPGVYRKVTQPLRLYNYKASAVSAGGEHSMFINLVDSTVWTFGNNQFGQLGHGDNISRFTPTMIPGIRAKAVSSGGEHSMILDFEGNVWVFGNNKDGRLGLGDIKPRNQPVKVPGIKGRAISAGTYHSVIIAQDGSVWFSGPRTIHRATDRTYLSFTKLPLRGAKVSSGWGFILAAGQSVD